MTRGERIRIFREERGLTQEELGKLCHTTKQTIQKYESGIVTNIPLERMEQLAHYLGTTPEVLAGWEEKPAISPVLKEITGILSGMDEAQLAQVASYIKYVKSQG